VASKDIVVYDAGLTSTVSSSVQMSYTYGRACD
jgi:hypothetical protein